MPRLTSRLAIALLFAVSLTLLGPGLLPGRVIADHGTEQVLPMGDPSAASRLPQANADTVRENLVYRKILHDTLRSGEIPWWEPGMYGGTPFVAMSHTQALYPLTWLTLPLSPAAAHSWLLWFHVCLAGVGAFAWLRAAGRSEAAALVGGLAFMLNGMFATRHGHPQYVAVGAWLPWILLGVEGLFREDRVRWLAAAGIAAVTAMMILAGHPSIYVFGSYFVGLYLLWRAVQARRWAAVEALALFVLAYLIGAALASTQLFAVLELADFSARSERSVASLTRRLHHWVHLLRMLFPDLTGSMADGSYFSPRFTHYWAGTLYNGVAPLFLAALVPFVAERRARWIAGIALGVLLLLFVPTVFRAAYYLPGFAFGRVDRASIAFFLALAWLSASAFDALCVAPERFSRPIAAIGAGWVLLAIAAVPATQQLAEAMRVPDAWNPGIAARAAVTGALLAVAVAACLRVRARLGRDGLAFALVALMCVDLGPWWREWAVARDADLLFPATETTDFLRAHTEPGRIAKYIPHEVRGTGIWPMFPSNLPAAYDLEEIHGFGPLHLHNLDILLTEAEVGRTLNPWHVLPFTHTEALDSPILDLLNVRYIVADERIDSLPVAFEGELWVHDNPGYLPRAWFVPEAVDGTNLRVTAAELAAGVRDPRAVVSVVPFSGGGPSPSPEGSGEIQLMTSGRGELVVEKRGEAPGYVVLAESWYPGWEATVDGVPTAVLQANVVQRAVAVPGGTHTVHMRYKPTFARSATVLTLFGAAAWLGLLVPWLRRERPDGSA